MDNDKKNQLLSSFKRSKMMLLFEAEVDDVKEGYFEFTIPQKEFMTRPAGMFNGSTIASIIDVSAGYAAASSKPQDCYFTTVELKVNYLNPAYGNKLTTKAQTIKSGKVITVVRSDVFAYNNEIETCIATSLVTLMQINK